MQSSFICCDLWMFSFVPEEPRQLEDSAQLLLQKNLPPALVLMVRPIGRCLRTQHQLAGGAAIEHLTLRSSAACPPMVLQSKPLHDGPQSPLVEPGLLFVCRFVASFAYYGSVLSSSELLEKNLLCVTNADQDHQVKHRHQGGVCYCIPFGYGDYQTLLISCLGEVACEWAE